MPRLAARRRDVRPSLGHPLVTNSTLKLSPNQPCPCGAGVKYKRCCRVYHGGQAAPDPETLMRSRFSAYAGGLADYVIVTTDPAGPAAEVDRAGWFAAIRAFCSETSFEGLTVLESSTAGDVGHVEFHAQLRQGDADASFLESSRFVRLDGRWLYHSGEVRPDTEA